MKNKFLALTIILGVFLILIFIFFNNIKKINNEKEYFGFGLISLLMNIKDIYDDDNNFLYDYFKNINKDEDNNENLLKLALYINNNSNNDLNINVNILSKFKLIHFNINKKCFIYELNFKNIDSIFEPKKQQYIKSIGRISYNKGGNCDNSDECLFIFTEKGILKIDEQYNCD